MAKWFSQLRSLPAETLQTAGLTPQQQALLAAVDFSKSSGDAWGKIGKQGVLNYMQDSLRKRYGTDDISKFRYIEAPDVPGGYMLDWDGRAPATGFKQGLKNAARSVGLVAGAPGGDASDGSPMTMGNPSQGLDFGATWEGKGGTTFGFYRKPDGSVGIRTGSAQSNDTADILTAAAILTGGYMAGTGALGGAAAGGAAEGAAAAGAAEGAAAAGALDLGGGLAMTADGAITGATMAGGQGMSGAALDALISGGGSLGGSMTSFGIVDPAYANMRVTAPGVITNNGVTTFGVMDPAARSMMSAHAAELGQAGASGAVAGAGGGGGGAPGPVSPAGGGLGPGSITGSKLGDAILTKGAGMALTGLLTPDAPDAPQLPASTGRSPESITKAVSEMPDPLAQQRARKRSLTEQLGRRGRASTIMTKPSGRLGG